MPERVIVFIDGQNFYRGARRAFFSELDPHVGGQFWPHLLGARLCERTKPGETRQEARELQEVRIYTGLPSATHEPKTYGAHRKQSAAWKRQSPLVRVIERPLRYPPGFPKSGRPAQEKGIDVHLALDFVILAIQDRYDVGILVSTDTDLVPALEAVRNNFKTRRVEVAAWRNVARSYQPRLVIPTGSSPFPWCHWLEQEDYEAVKDETNYAK